MSSVRRLARARDGTNPVVAVPSLVDQVKDQTRIAAKRTVYGVNQLARIGWYTSHYAASRRKMGPATEPGKAPDVSAFSPLDRARLTASYRELLVRDWQHVRDGIYKLPAEFNDAPSLKDLWRKSRDYLLDTERVAQRKYKRAHSEVLTTTMSSSFPRYYLQNFHFQSDGWLTQHSAARYDMQVETLFTGAAMAMRRQALPHIADAIGNRNPVNIRLIDVACGTGCFLREVLHNWPKLNATALDLSPAYIEKARTVLGKYPHIEYRRAPAEETGLADAHFDIISCVYLFHELPPKVRRAVAAEMGRIVKPGGVVVLTDTLQYGDEPGLDGLLEAFPKAFHEPYYDSYCRETLREIFADAGFEKRAETTGFLTKSTVFIRNC
ncbi:MAG: class I SAM-dependent methyltransferase [Pseudomonadota bacterium]